VDLNIFVQNYLPADLRRGRDFEGGRGWVFIYNQLIRRFENEGLIRSETEYEVPVYLEDALIGPHLYRENLIMLPADFIRAIDVFEFDLPQNHYAQVFEGGRLKLTDAYEDTTIEYKTGTTPYTVAAAPTTTAFTIDKTTTAAGELKDYGFFVVNGAAAYESRTIDHSAVSGAATVLYVRKPVTAIAQSDTLVLLSNHLMLRYFGRYPLLANFDDAINVADHFNTALVHGMSYLAYPFSDKRRKEAQKEFEIDLADLGKSEATPSLEELRPVPGAWPNLDETKEDKYDYIGPD
jgi:hypothetical protein